MRRMERVTHRYNLGTTGHASFAGEELAGHHDKNWTAAGKSYLRLSRPTKPVLPSEVGFTPRGNQTEYIITTVNNPDFKNTEHLAKDVSVRLSRAVRKAQALVRAGNPNVMLFRETKKGLVRISLKSRQSNRG